MKYFVDEHDCSNIGTPLMGIRECMVWFDSKEEASREIERQQNLSNGVPYTMWDENLNEVKD